MSSGFFKAAVLFVVLFLVFEAGYFFSRAVDASDGLQGSLFNPGFPLLPNEQRLSASVNIVSVSTDGTRGQVNTGIVEIVPNGQGRVLIDTNPFVEPDTQQSLETAAFVAASYTKKNLSDKDIIYSISNTNAQLIGGPSAGAAFTLATIAAIGGKQLRKDAAITGTINSDGSIGAVGGIVEKLNVLAAQNAKLFLIPSGQSNVITYSEEVSVQRRGNIVYEVRRLVPKQFDLVELGKQQGIEVKEVSDIREAVFVLIQ